MHGPASPRGLPGPRGQDRFRGSGPQQPRSFRAVRALFPGSPLFGGRGRRLFLAAALLAGCGKHLECPAAGLGGDSELNRLKNRTVPPDSVREIAAAAFLAEYPPDMRTPKEHDEFTRAQRDSIEPREAQGLALTGYLVAAIRAFPELSNCLDPEDEDWHLNLYPAPPAAGAPDDSLIAGSIITEVSPRWQDMRKGVWAFDSLQALARRRAEVRISGWVMYDPEHPSHLGRLRATLWEIHPITAIEVRVGGAWVPLGSPMAPPAVSASRSRGW
jgi:hypothetical protein